MHAVHCLQVLHDRTLCTRGLQGGCPPCFNIGMQSGKGPLMQMPSKISSATLCSDKWLSVWWQLLASSHVFLFSPQAMHHVFFEAYDWPPFIIALGASLLGMLLAAAVENLLLRPLLGDVCAPCMPRAATLPPAEKLQDGAHATWRNGVDRPSAYAAEEEHVQKL